MLAERQVAVSLCRLNCFEEARLLFIHRETTVLEINGTIQGPRERSLLGAFETSRESLTMVYRCWRRSERETGRSTMHFFLAIPKIRIMQRTRALRFHCAFYGRLRIIDRDSEFLRANVSNNRRNGF